MFDEFSEMFDEFSDGSILTPPRFPARLALRTSPHPATIAKRFSGVLGMFSSLEVKVLYPT